MCQNPIYQTRKDSKVVPVLGYIKMIPPKDVKKLFIKEFQYCDQNFGGICNLAATMSDG
jgi:hypothetical protein